MNVVPLREYIFVVIGSVVLSVAALAILFAWARQARTLVIIALTVAVGIVIWNSVLNVTNAAFLNVDSPLLGLSAQDVGSGVGAFLVTAIVLRFVTHRSLSTGQVLWASAVVGLVTILVDLFG